MKKTFSFCEEAKLVLLHHGDQMSLRKRSPKMLPKPFFGKKD
jgi:hypothetical protein